MSPNPEGAGSSFFALLPGVGVLRPCKLDSSAVFSPTLDARYSGWRPTGSSRSRGASWGGRRCPRRRERWPKASLATAERPVLGAARSMHRALGLAFHELSPWERCESAGHGNHGQTPTRWVTVS